MAHKKLMVRGFDDRHPIYGSDSNWCTEALVGDKLICSFGGFGSEMLVRGAEYTVVECNGQLLLQATDGCIIGSYDTWNTMPFFLKVRQETKEQNGHIAQQIK